MTILQQQLARVLRACQGNDISMPPPSPFRPAPPLALPLPPALSLWRLLSPQTSGAGGGCALMGRLLVARSQH